MLYKQIRCFLEVARCLSFTAAAKNLYMTQQAVTKQVAALEQEIGVKLFNRSTRSVSLTPAGQSLRDDFADLHRQINLSIKKAKNIAGGKKSTISIGFLSALSKQSIIIPMADCLFHTFPDISFDLKLQDFAELRNHLLDGKLDLCVTTSNDWKLWPEVKVDVLQSKPFEIVYSATHPLADMEPFSLDELKPFTQLTLPRDNLMPGGEEWARQLPFHDSILCPDLDTMRILLETGRGFALLTRVFEGYESPALRYQPIPIPAAHAEVVCIRRLTREPGLEPVVKVMRSEFASSAENAQNID